MAAHLHLVPSPVEAGSTSEGRLPIRVLLAESHALMRSSLRQLLEDERDIPVIGEAQDLPATVSHVHGDRPHVLVFDLSLRGGSGPDTVGELRERAPDTQIVVLTMNDSVVFAQRALAAGAVGFVLKNRADSELVEAVRAASRLEEYVSPCVRDGLRVFRHCTPVAGWDSLRTGR